MPGIQTPANLAALKTRLHRDFQAGLTKPSATHSRRLGLYSYFDSDTEFSTYEWLASQTGLKRWIGPRIVEGFKERAYTIFNEHFEKTVEVSANKLDDSPMTAVGNAAARLAVLMEGADKLEDDLMFNPVSTAMGAVSGLIARGASTVCYDGQFYYDQDHPIDLDSTGTQSNYEPSGFALTAPNYAAARARMMSFKGENNRPLGVLPNLLLVPPALEKTAREIVLAQIGSSGATNVMAGTAEVQVVPELAGLSDTRWFLFDTISVGPKPFILQNRSPLRLVAKTDMNTSDEVFDRNVHIWGLDRRVGAGFGLWQRAFSAAA